VRVLPQRAEDEDVLADEPDVATAVELGTRRSRGGLKVEVLDRRARIDGIARKKRIQPRVERDARAGMREPVAAVHEVHVLPAGGAVHAQLRRDGPLRQHPCAPPAVVLLEKRIRSAQQTGADLYSRQRSATEVLFELR